MRVLGTPGAIISSFFALIFIILVPILSIGAIVIFCLLILSYVGITSWPVPPSLPTLLTFMALSMAVILSMVWMLAANGRIKLEESAYKLIQRAFIGAVLAAVASAVTTALQNS